VKEACEKKAMVFSNFWAAGKKSMSFFQLFCHTRRDVPRRFLTVLPIFLIKIDKMMTNGFTLTSSGPRQGALPSNFTSIRASDSFGVGAVL